LHSFLNQLARYDGERQRPLFDPKDLEKGKLYKKAKILVIDECSMLTMDDLFAIFRALDMAHAQRIILVGDPNQLPPIGPGRPALFASGPALVDADRILADIEAGKKLNDLQVCFWDTAERLQNQLLSSFQSHLKLKNEHDVAGLTALGICDKGWVLGLLRIKTGVGIIIGFVFSILLAPILGAVLDQLPS